MSKLNTENPPYITVVAMFGVYHVNRMEWDERADGYIVYVSKQVLNAGDANYEAQQWADREGLEVR